ncbi:MAG: adenylate kinase [Oscillatoriales cyanobacterium RM2_1_1]|nr:adenylate kinase [Oscillatoriales cyanobacterium SM2_3_0]NJO44351.1 adenylate kinase [Oscillatoriales cyanobacterium RM2_1_1]
MVQIILLGPPGSGKGTQAARLAGYLEIPHISTGNILRLNVSEGTELGQKAKVYMDRGDLVPDQLILDMVKERLSQTDAYSGWILDGFPRNVPQAQFLESLLKESSELPLATLDDSQSADQTVVVNLDVPDGILIQRLLTRSADGDRRSDDNEATILHRLSVYREQTAPLIEFYQARQQLVQVNGNLPIDQVATELLTVLDNPNN